MLKTGSIDFVGQKQSYDFQFYVIWIAGIIGFVVGYIYQRFLYTFYCVFGATVVVTILCLPAWPIWNRNPVKWLEPYPDGSEDEDEKKAKKKEKSEQKDRKDKKE